LARPAERDNATALSKNLNQVVLDNRAEIHEVLLNLRAALVEARHLIVNVDETVQENRDNLDETMENVRATTQNLKQFSDTIKQRPNSLVFAKAKKDPVPPAGK
jgi:hypothetical protein